MRQNCTAPGKRYPPGVHTKSRLIATFLPDAALTIQSLQRSQEETVFSCDYNGWADVPEEEREGMEAFEATLLVQRPPIPLPPVFGNPARLLLPPSHRRAA
jgi:hypothetical protein